MIAHSDLLILLIAFEVAIVGVVFTTVLMEPGEVFGFYRRLLEKLAYKEGDYGKKTFFGKVFSKPLGLCSVCFSGQLALWSGFYFVDYTSLSEGIITHIIFISLVIFLCQKSQKG